MATSIIDKYSKEELEQIVSECHNKNELIRRLGYKTIGRNFDTIKKRLECYNISYDHFIGPTNRKVTKRTVENVFCKNSTANQATLRRWYSLGEYTPYKCSICGLLPFWNNKPLTLTLDHINGNNHDNELVNLRWVCPNCDRQLDTFAGRNVDHTKNYNYSNSKKYCVDCGEEITSNAIRCQKCFHLSQRKVERPNKEILFQELINNKGNFVQIGMIYGVSDNAIRKWCKNYNLPYHSGDYKNKQ